MECAHVILRETHDDTFFKGTIADASCVEKRTAGSTLSVCLTSQVVW